MKRWVNAALDRTLKTADGTSKYYFNVPDNLRDGKYPDKYDGLQAVAQDNSPGY